MQASRKIILISALATCMFPVVTYAVQSPMDKSPQYNYTLLSLVSLMVILLFIIGVLANTMRQLSQVVRDKIRKDRSGKSTTAVVILLLAGGLMSSLQAIAADALPVAGGQSIDGILASDFYLLVSVIAFEIFIIFALIFYINVLLKVIRARPELEAQAEAVIRKSWFWDKFNKAATIEEEEEILLDHNYDGIQELDNSLPPWWKYGFYLTIVVAVIYIYRYHISHDGMSQHEEFVAEMEQGERDKAAYLAKSANNVDENTVTYLTDQATLVAGQNLFVKVCAACHLTDGGGSVGPNLTDDYWLHGGSIQDIFKSIKYGWQDKGMKSWKDDYSPKQIQELACYIKSLRGTKPVTPKDPQGELYIEATTTTDSTAVVDSAASDSEK